MENQNIKAVLFQRCVDFIEERIATASTALQQAREASNDDTKSSAGDKYETSREMAQQDIDRNKRLLMDAEDLLRTLMTVKDIPFSESVRNGSLVVTDQGKFYLAVSAGLLQGAGEPVFAISAISPIGKLMLGKRKGQGFDFNGKKYSILAVH